RQFSAVSNDFPGIRQSIVHRKRWRLNGSSLPLRIRFSSRLFIRRLSSSGNLGRHFRLPAILVHHFLTQNPLGRKRPPVNHLKRFVALLVVFMFSQIKLQDSAAVKSSSKQKV